MAITRAQQFRQMLEDGGMLVKPGRGKRPGYRGAGEYQGGKSSKGVGGKSMGPGGPKGPGGPRGGRPDSKPDDRSSDLQTFNQKKIAGKLGRIDQMGGPLQYKDGILIDESGRRVDKTFRGGFTGDLNEREKAFQKFLNYRKPVKGFGFSKFFEGPMQAFSDFSAGINRPYFEKVIRAGRIPGLNFDMSFEEFEDAYQDYMSDRLAGKIDAMGNLKSGFMRDASGNIISTGNDGRDLEAERLALLAQTANQNQATTPTQPTSAIDPIFYRLAADGGMIEDAPVGGIMDLESGRQMYFLGKLVKKATRAVKKIVKSPLGKAALIGGLGYLGLKGGLGTFLKTKAAPFLFKGGEKFAADKIGLGKLLSSGLTGGGMLALGGALTAAPLLFGKQEDDDDTIDPSMLGPRLDIASLLANPYQATLGTGFRRTAADGGRIGYNQGTTDFMDFVRSMGVSQSELQNLDINSYNAILQAYEKAKEGEKPVTKKADGGRIGYQEGSKEPVAKKTMPLLDMDGKEMDLRDNGGFVPIGRMEKADDVPARLSKNEFVFTADAVRNAGDGDIDKGAEVMYNMMKNLEDGGDVSEESQGLEGARNMFQTAQRLEEVL